MQPHQRHRLAAFTLRKLGLDTKSAPKQPTLTKLHRDSDTFSFLDRKFTALGLTPDMWGRSGRKPIKSIYSIDVPRDTVYLTVDQGRSVKQPYPSRARSPSPDFSEFGNDSPDHDSFDLKPPVPLKNLKARMQFGKRKQSKSGMPFGLSAKAPEWESLQPPQEPSESRFSWSTRDHHDSPELPDPDIGASLREDLPLPANSRFSWTTYATEAPSYDAEADALPDLSSLTFSPHQHHDMPRSRFSWSTHNTKGRESFDQPASVHSTPHQGAISPPSPPPTPPQSVLDRRRPLPRPDEFGFYPDKQAIKRKPTPSPILSDETHSAPTSAVNGDKALPLIPSPIDSIDRVALLKLELDSLEYRRYNLEKVISGLTALQPSNPVEFDLAKRREQKERIEAFERELADVRRKEHELGLRLHKAIRRRDDDEPTGLWVRRVTG